MDFKTYQKLRSYCRGDLAAYLDTPGRQAALSLALKLHGATGELKHELDQAKALIALTKDLTPREHDAAHLLAVISNHRAIAWHRELEPPDGKEQATPLSPEQTAALWAQTREAVEAYGVHLPEREAESLSGAMRNAYDSVAANALAEPTTWATPSRLMPDEKNQFLQTVTFEHLDPWTLYDSWPLKTACKLIVIGYPVDLDARFAEAKDWPANSEGRMWNFAAGSVLQRAMEIASSSVKAGLLSDPDTPANWLAWAERKGYDVKHLKPLATPPSTVQNGTVTAPVLAASASAGTDQTLDPERRLARLRALGGSYKYVRGGWKFIGIKELVRSEKDEGRKRSDEKTIRADLKDAAQAERDAKSAGFGAGLGQR